jgi:LysR family hydrogen peroxide-inducible transcriptional activator
LRDGTLDAAIAATPLEEDDILEQTLYYEPFVGYIPKHHSLQSKKSLQKDDISPDDVLLLEDGHCFKNNVLNLCQSDLSITESKFNLESGSFEKPQPAREVSLIYHKSELKIHIIDALKELILSIVKGAIEFEDVEIISPIEKEKQKNQTDIAFEQLR